MKTALITYDIADDKRRNRVSELLETFGPRVQLSVFEVQADRLEGVVDNLRHLIDPVTDQIRCYRLADDLESIRTILGDRCLEERLSYLIV